MEATERKRIAAQIQKFISDVLRPQNERIHKEIDTFEQIFINSNPILKTLLNSADAASSKTIMTVLRRHLLRDMLPYSLKVSSLRNSPNITLIEEKVLELYSKGVPKDKIVYEVAKNYI